MRSVYNLGLLAESHLRALEPTVIVFTGEADGASRDSGYVIIDLDPGSVRYSRAAGDPDHDMRFRLRVCGSSPNQTSNTLDLVRAHLKDWSPFPLDLALGPLREKDAGPFVMGSAGVGDPRWSCTLTYELDDGDDYA